MTFVHEYDSKGKPLVISEIKSLATTVEGAQGKTPDIMDMDETSRNRYAKQIYGASKPGIDKAGGRIIIISNSHKDGVGWGWTRGIYTGAMKGLNAFQRIFMPWWDCPERLTPLEEKRLRDHPSGFDDKGKVIAVDFRTQQISGGYDEDDFSQNYPETEQEAISAMAGSYFGKTLARHEAQCMPGVTGNLSRDRFNDIVFTPDPKGFVEVWRYPYYLVDGWDGHYWRRRYAIGSDVSEGLGQSYSVGYIIDRHHDEMVCRVRSNRMDAVQWADLLHLVGIWYCNASEHKQVDGALICVERTGAGQTTVKELMKKENPVANQYVRMRSGKIGSPIVKEFGWHESEQSKHELCGDLKSWFRNTQGGIYDALLIEECSHTIKHEGSSRIGPEDETKLWDCVVGAGCAIQASNQLGEPAERIEKPAKGWLKEWQDGKRGSPWAV